MYYYNLGHYFSDVAAAKDNCLALRYPNHSYSYKELMGQVEALSAVLIEKECDQGDVIAIGHTKQPLSYALMLAGLRLGITYVIVDVTSPQERNTRILQVSGACLLFYDRAEDSAQMSKLAKENECELVLLDKNTLTQPAAGDLVIQKEVMTKVDGACIAYIMFTSGSTGIPKGVAVTHQNILHLISWGQQYFDIDTHDNFANLSPMYFDNSVFDFYVGLFSGASLSPIPKELLSKPYELIAYIEQLECSIWFSVPTLLIYLNSMKAIPHNSLPTLRKIIFGGEGYPKTELKKLYDTFSGQADLVNVYGPTECTCICSAHTINDKDFEDTKGLPTLGSLNPNFDFSILDENNEESESGELCLIGPNVAAGYYNDLDRTLSAFETLIDKNRFMKRMYRTGDLVQIKNGKLYFLGRKDNQIKHMGYRIELEDIEASINSIPKIIQAAVVYKRKSVAYGKIICYIKPAAHLGTKEVMEQLSRKLPEYMLPNKIHIIDELPKYPNGKIDRKHLAAL